MKFSIIIVTWNGLNWIQKFLPAVVSSNYDSFEIIVADNASTDGTANWIQTHYPSVHCLSFDQNYGYCKGNNLAAANAKGELLLFLNNDVQVTNDWLVPIAKAFDSNASLGAAQPKMRSYHHPDYFEYAGAAGGLMDYLGYPFCRGRIFDTCEQDLGQYDQAEVLFWASGAALVIRRSLFMECGGFDEDYQFHMEEIDLCWKVQRKGWQIISIPNSIVYHVGGASLDQSSPRKLYLNFRNNLDLLTKHLPAKRLVFVLPMRIVMDVLALCRELIKGKKAHAKAILRAEIDYLKRLPHILKKRSQLISQSFPFNTHQISPIILPWHYFILRRKTVNELLP
jgi:GT2 family glycosyltransferase